MKIVAISPSPRSLEAIDGYLREGGTERTVELIEGGMSKLRSVADQRQPDLIIVEGLCRDVEELGALEHVNLHHPQMMVVMLSSNHTPEFLINAMRAGVKEVLPAPATKEALQAAVARIESKLGRAAKPRPAGQILAFIACKGGSGATFLATNLGYQLASTSKKVLLIDFNLQFGDAVLFMHDRKPTTNLADVARNMQRLDASFLATSLVQVTPDFGILAAPEDPGQAMEVKPEHVDALLNLAVSHYDFVIVDVGRILDAIILRALDRANLIFPVLQTTLPFVRDTHRLLTVFRSLGYSPEKISIIINRLDKSGDLELADIEKSLGVSNARTIPNSYSAVAASVNRGIPISQLAKNNAVARSIEAFAQSLLPREETNDGWLGRLLKRA